MPAGRARGTRLCLAAKLVHRSAFRFPTQHQAVGVASMLNLIKQKPPCGGFVFKKKVRVGIEPTNKSFADSRLTTWPPHREIVNIL